MNGIIISLTGETISFIVVFIVAYIITKRFELETKKHISSF
jgi:uncharacterized membrane protein